MPLFADDPDVNQVYPISATRGTLDFAPVVRIDGLPDITAEWEDPDDTTSPRNLRVPLYGLPSNRSMTLRLLVPGDNDVELGRIVLRSRGLTEPEPPAWTDAFRAEMLAIRDSINGGGSGSGGTDVLTLVDGGTFTLDDTKAEGTLVGYRVKTTATFEGEGGTTDLEPGAYTFERTDSGWVYYLATGFALGSTSGPVVQPSGWTALATDAFTGTGDLSGHSTTTGGFTWVSGDGTLLLDGDEAVWNTHGTGASNILPLGATHPAGLRSSFDYRPGDVAAAGSRFSIVTAINYTSTRYDNEQFAGVQFELQVDGTVTLTENMVGLDTLGLTGTMTGHPTSGRFGIQILGTAFSVTLNGTTIATGTIPGTLLGSKFRLGGYNRSIAYDNLTVEASA